MRLGLRASLSGYFVAILAVMAIALFREALRGILVDTAIYPAYLESLLDASAPGTQATAS